MSLQYVSHTLINFSDTQQAVFNCCVKDIVESVLQGYNGSIIASGQTG